MARKLVNVGHILKRYLSSQAQPAKVRPSSVSSFGPHYKIKEESNGIITICSEQTAPIARVAVVIAGGSRYERNDQQGITHYLRLLSSQATIRLSALGLSRTAMQMGANISCTSHREYMVYTIECLKNYVDDTIELLRMIVTTPCFKPWEISDLEPYMRYDLAVLDSRPDIKCIEAVVEAGFRDTVGRSLYMRECDIGKYTTDHLMEYVMSHYIEGATAIASLGVPEEQLAKAVETFQLHPSKGDRVKKEAEYHGGEIRICTESPIVYASVCTQGIGFGHKDAYPAWVLRNIMGGGSRIKYSEGTVVSRLGQSIPALEILPHNALTCVNIHYSDSGLFGFMAAAPPRDIGKVLEGAYGAFAKLAQGDITDDEVKRGKNMAKSSMYMCLEEGEHKLLDMADQALWNGNVVSMHDVARNIDKVTTAEVNAFAKSIIKGRLSMAAVGDLTHTPYLRDLK